MFSVLSSARKAICRTVLAASVLALAACDTSMMTNLGGGALDASKPVRVALLAPYSDPGAGAIAQSLENAARLAIAGLDGVTVDLRVFDTGGDPDKAAAQAQRAADEGAQLILGPLFGEAANAAGKAVADDGLNVLAFSNNPTIAGGNVFILGQTFENTATRLLRYSVAQGKDDVVVVYPETIEGSFGRTAVEKAAAVTGARVAGAQSFPFSQDGVASSVGQIRATVQGSGADAVVLTSNAAGALPLLLQMLPEAGIDPEVTQYIGLSRWDIPSQLLSMRGAQGGLFALPEQSSSTAFTNRYREQYGSDPHPLAGLAFDGIAALGALVQSGRDDTLGAASLTQPAGFRGSSGIFRFLGDGTTERGLAVATVQNNQVIILDPAPTSFGRAGF